MTNRMNGKAGREIVALAASKGFQHKVREDGSRRFTKYLVFESSTFASPVFIFTESGFGADGNLSGDLRVAVHPNAYRRDLEDGAAGITAAVNRRKGGTNRFSSSNFVGFPVFPDNDEPCALCYSVETGVRGLAPFAHLLDGFSRAGGKHV